METTKRKINGPRKKAPENLLILWNQIIPGYTSVLRCLVTLLLHGCGKQSSSRGASRRTCHSELCTSGSHLYNIQQTWRRPAATRNEDSERGRLIRQIESGQESKLGLEASANEYTALGIIRIY